MAKQRKGKATQVQAEPQTAVDTVTPNTNTTNGERKLMALSAEQIQALLGKTRQKGQYLDMLTEFVNSGEGGVCANEQWVAIRDKKATTIKQGFENAKEKKEAPAGSENVKVISNEDQVYLINLAAEAVAAEADAA